MNTLKVLGASAAVLLLSGVAHAQTSTTSTSTPGVPNAGAGGAASLELMVLLVSAFVVAAGIGYLYARSRKTSY